MDHFLYTIKILYFKKQSQQLQHYQFLKQKKDNSVQQLMI